MGFSVEQLNSIGTTILSGDTTINGGLNVAGDQVFSGYTTIVENLDVDGDVQFDGTLTVNSNFTVNSSASLPNMTIDKEAHGGALWEYKEAGQPFDYGIDADYVAGDGILKVRTGLIMSGSTLTSFGGVSGITVNGKSQLSFYTFTGTSTGTMYAPASDLPAGHIEGNAATTLPNIPLDQVAIIFISPTTNLGQDIQAWIQVVNATYPSPFEIIVQDDSSWAVYKIAGANDNGVWPVTFKYGSADANVKTFADLGVNCRTYFVVNGLDGAAGADGTSPYKGVFALNTSYVATNMVSLVELLGLPGTLGEYYTFTGASFGVDTLPANGYIDVSNGGGGVDATLIKDCNRIYIPGLDASDTDLSTWLGTLPGIYATKYLLIQTLDDSKWAAWNIEYEFGTGLLYSYAGYAGSSDPDTYLTSWGLVKVGFIDKVALYHSYIATQDNAGTVLPSVTGGTWLPVNGVNGTSGTDGTSGSSGTDGTSGTNGLVDLSTITDQHFIYNNNGVASGGTFLQRTANGISINGAGLNVGTNNTNVGLLGLTVGDTCTAQDDGNNNIAMGVRNVANYGGTNIGGADSVVTTSVYGVNMGGQNNSVTGSWYSANVGGYYNTINAAQKAGNLGGDHLVNNGYGQAVVGTYNTAEGSNNMDDLNSPRFIVGTSTGSSYTESGFKVYPKGHVVIGGNLTVNGTFIVDVKNKTASYTGTTSDYVLTFSGTTLDLHLPASSNSGQVIIVKNLAASNLTVTADGADLIDGEAVKTLTTQYQSITLVDSATGVWIVI